MKFGCAYQKVSVRSENAELTIREIIGAPPNRRHVVPNFEKMDVIAEIKRLTDGKGVDVAIKALGTQNTFEMRSAHCAPEERYPAWACILASFPRA